MLIPGHRYRIGFPGETHGHVFTFVATHVHANGVIDHEFLDTNLIQMSIYDLDLMLCTVEEIIAIVVT